jgi:hypothetical protein
MIELAQRFTYGAAGDALATLREGWSILEPDFTWTNGPTARLRLPFQPRTGQLTLELGLGTFVMPPTLPRQRLRIEVNGTTVASDTVGAECTLGIDIPPQAVANTNTLDIVLHCPDATIPPPIGVVTETRKLGICLHEIMLYWSPPPPPHTPRTRPPLPDLPGGLPQAAQFLTALSIPDLATQFESLGHNCEFGLAQRRMGAEPLGLLRFAGTTPRRLIEALDLEFEGIDAPGNLITWVNTEGHDSEYFARDKRYGIHVHSELSPRTTTQAEVLTIFYRNLTFLRRKFLEDLRGAGKIFVYQHWEARSLAHARPILNMLRSHGPNTLLFVMPDDTRPSGTVVQMEEDLLQGSIASLSPIDGMVVTSVNETPWVHLCANAYRLWRESGRGA